jgi:hypothetical protein
MNDGPHKCVWFDTVHLCGEIAISLDVRSAILSKQVLPIAGRHCPTPPKAWGYFSDGPGGTRCETLCITMDFEMPRSTLKVS